MCLFPLPYAALRALAGVPGGRVEPRMQLAVPQSATKSGAVQSCGSEAEDSEEGGERAAGLVGGEQVAEVGEQGAVL